MTKRKFQIKYSFLYTVWFDRRSSISDSSTRPIKLYWILNLTFFLFSTWQSKKYKGRVLFLSFCLFFLLLIDRSIYTTRIFLFFLYRAPLADVNVSILLSLIYMSMRGWECTMRDNVSICRIGWRTENLFLCFCYEKSPDSYCNQPEIIDKQNFIDSFLLHLQYILTVSTHESCDLS